MISPERVSCIVVPHYRNFLTEEESASWNQLNRLLGYVSKFVLLPKSLKNKCLFPGAKKIFFSDSFFEYPFGYNRLLLQQEFYKCFSSFEFIFIHQLDCMVFRDELAGWCKLGFDYIGAPWFMDENKNPTPSPASVGNGGFSLRKVSTAVKVLSSRIKRGTWYPKPHQYAPQPTGLNWFFWNIYRRLRQHLGIWRVQDELENFFENEDVFWSFHAQKVFPGYKKASVEEALDFAFEVEPKKCVEMNGGKIPFGCHAWAKHDKKFVKNILSLQNNQNYPHNPLP